MVYLKTKQITNSGSSIRHFNGKNSILGSLNFLESTVTIMLPYTIILRLLLSTHFKPMFYFSMPENITEQKVFYVVKGWKNGTLARNELKGF